MCQEECRGICCFEEDEANLVTLSDGRKVCKYCAEQITAPIFVTTEVHYPPITSPTAVIPKTEPTHIAVVTNFGPIHGQ